MGKLDGKLALVTGGTSGIGLATAKLFVAEGAHVYVTGRRQVAKMADLDRLFKQIEQENGKLDIVFANAGAAEYGPFGQVDEAQFDRLFDSNVKGTLFSVQKALPLMPDGGAIVLNGSVVGSKGFPANTVYAATKAAVRSFARTWTTDLKERKIRVNVVSPSPTDTDGLREAIKSNEAAQQRIRSLVQTVPLGRLGRVDEIAKAVLFLASDDSSFVTGAELFADGGMGQV